MPLNEQIQQLNEAVIRATEMINRLNEEKQEEYERGYAEGYADGQDQAEINADNDAAIEPCVTQKSGEWIERQNIARTNLETAVNLRWAYECSKCGYEVLHRTRYCPSCGCRMRGAE